MSTPDLNSLGITTEEYSLYRAVLKEPVVNVSRYAEKLGIKRPTLYNLLDGLVAKGLLKKSGSGARYSAESPEELLKFAESAKQRTLDQIQTLRKELPLLAMLGQSVQEDSEVIVLRGPEVYDRLGTILDEPTEGYLGFTYSYHVEVYFDFDRNGELIENDYLKTVMRVGDKFVFPGTDETIQQTQNLLRRYPYLEGKWQPRWVDPQNFDFAINMTVVEDKTAFTHVGHEKDRFACIIKDDKLAAAMKSISLFIWNHAHPIH